MSNNAFNHHPNDRALIERAQKELEAAGAVTRERLAEMIDAMVARHGEGVRPAADVMVGFTRVVELLISGVTAMGSMVAPEHVATRDAIFATVMGGADDAEVEAVVTLANRTRALHGVDEDDRLVEICNGLRGLSKCLREDSQRAKTRIIKRMD